MLRVAICDKDEMIHEKIEIALKDIGRTQSVDLHFDSFSSYEELLQQLSAGQKFELIFININMNDKGVETALRIRELDMAAQLIYVTADQKYTTDAFRAAPVGFLSKPIDSNDLAATFINALKYVRNQDQFYRFMFKKVGYQVTIRDIIYIQSLGRNLNIVCADGKYMKRGKLSSMQEELAMCCTQFFRIHRCYCVNLRHVTKFTYADLTLSNGERLAISRPYRKKVKEMLIAL